jgi:hypothetical protein
MVVSRAVDSEAIVISDSNQTVNERCQHGRWRVTCMYACGSMLDTYSYKQQYDCY